jgi:LPS O-antigen subunit length determinant protein (WzzB/FepE family)
MNTVWLIVGIVMMVALFALAMTLVVMPAWVKRILKTDWDRSQARMRRTGERNAYIHPDTDEGRFLRQLRCVAVGAALLSLGILLGLLLDR